jgi:hypothetical protein
MNKVCNKCGIDQPLTSYSYRNKVTGELRSQCKACCSAHRKHYYTEHTAAQIQNVKQYTALTLAINRTNVINHLNNNPCVDCGCSDVRVLQFDHIDHTSKAFSIAAKMDKYNWCKLYQEISKCVVRCANCHLIRTGKQFGYWREAVTKYSLQSSQKQCDSV